MFLECEKNWLFLDVGVCQTQVTKKTKSQEMINQKPKPQMR